jgi:urea carboxylase-associated protein 2
MSPLYEIELSGAGMWSRIIGRHKTLRLTDLEGGANVGLLLYHATERHERYNMPDTLKGQHIFFLRAPYCIHSDMGRLFASITQDSVGWHDTVCGCGDAALVARKYGQKDYQTARNEFHRDARECFLIELAKWELGERDLVPNLNLFSKVVADDEGRLSFVSENSKAGGSVSLRFEMDTLVVLNTCQHPLDPDPAYHPRRVKLEVFASPPPATDDPSLTVRPENARAHRSTEEFYLLAE